MIDEFTVAWFKGKHEIEKNLKKRHPKSYGALIRAVVKMLGNHVDRRKPDVKKIKKIDHGNHEGTLVYIVGEQGYLPSRYWVCAIYYGSCCASDAIQQVEQYCDTSQKPTEEQVRQYMTLCLHLIQNFKQIPINYTIGDDEFSPSGCLH